MIKFVHTRLRFVDSRTISIRELATPGGLRPNIMSTPQDKQHEFF